MTHILSKKGRPLLPSQRGDSRDRYYYTIYGEPLA